MKPVFRKLTALLFFTGISVFAFAQTDSLDTYILRLKQAKASGGSETAFMSLGSDFLYAQEYLEAGNYGAAVYSFEGVLRKDKDHPYANYQLATALLKLNDPSKRQYAQTVLANAFKVQPSLQAKFEKDFPSQSTMPVKAPPTVREPQTTLPQTTAATKGLDAYIKQIKYARSTGGSETVMNSAGLDAFYGIEYFEAGAFNSAETEFGLSLAKDPANPFVNYLMAVSMSAQSKAKQAETYLAKALAADPTLQQRFETDAAAARKTWKQREDAKAIKPTSPATVVKNGGKLVYGNYTCHVSVWNGPNASPAYRQDYKGYFALKNNGTYRWLDNGATGGYTYNPATGDIKWPSGYFKASQPKSSKYRIEGKYAHITIEMTENLRWECGCKIL